METVKRIISLYTESTPNPATMKFVANKMLLQGLMVEYLNAEQAQGSPLAQELFQLQFVNGVFIKNNFVAITKSPESTWEEVIPSTKEMIRAFLSDEEKVVLTEQAIEKIKEESIKEGGAKTDLEKQITEVIQTYVQPAVEMDGGSIVFRSFEDGKVTLGMQGACSGCPSSTVTLKAGIEGLLKRMVPQVTEVVAENM